MKIVRVFTTLVIFSSIFFTAIAGAGTRDDCIAKCQQASTFIKNRSIDAAVKEIRDKNGRFVWNDGVSYVFLMDLKGKMIAHPHKPELMKKASFIDSPDINGKLFFKEMVKKARNGKGWTKYTWPVPGKGVTKPKHTYIYRVPDTDYFVAAGFYVMAPGVFY